MSYLLNLPPDLQIATLQYLSIHQFLDLLNKNVITNQHVIDTILNLIPVFIVTIHVPHLLDNNYNIYNYVLIGYPSNPIDKNLIPSYSRNMDLARVGIYINKLPLTKEQKLEFLRSENIVVNGIITYAGSEKGFTQFFFPINLELWESMYQTTPYIYIVNPTTKPVINEVAELIYGNISGNLIVEGTLIQSYDNIQLYINLY